MHRVKAVYCIKLTIWIKIHMSDCLKKTQANLQRCSAICMHCLDEDSVSGVESDFRISKLKIRSSWV